MPEAVFVERELTARKGRKRSKLLLRVFAPVPQGAEYACSFELATEGRVLLPKHEIPGADSLQALVLALRIAAFELIRFEIETGMRIEAWQWMNVIEFIGDAPVDTYERDRINEIRAQLTAQTREHLETKERSRGPRAANSKPRAASRGRSR